MAIRIERNEAGNCINFHGTSNPTYWNACLSGEVDPDFPDTVNVINDIITAETGKKKTEFFRIPYTDFVNKEGNSFSDAQEAADYITEKANVIGLSGEGIDLTGQTVCFSLDATSTSVMLDTGHAFGVNTIKAIPHSDGTVHIVSNDGADNITHFHHLDAANTCVNGSPVSGGLQDVVNTLNELFTVGAFESVVISDPYATMVADVSGIDTNITLGGNAVDPTGNDIAGSTASGYNNSGILTTETINRAGEYFTFDIRGEGTIGMGLVLTDVNDVNGSSVYGDPATWLNGVNSGHYGYQFSHWFHPTPDGSWTNYGANTGYSMRSGWSGFPNKQNWLDGNPIKMRVGLDENGYISIDSYDPTTSLFVPHSRSSYVIAEGVEFRLGIKFGDTNARLYSLPKVHLLAEDVVDPTDLDDTSITVFGEGITGTLAGGISSSATDNFDNDGFVTTETISAIGEYFELDWSSGGDFNFGLFSENDHDVSDLTGDTTSWSASKYIFYGAEGRDGGGIQGVRTDAGLNYTNVGDGTQADYKARVGFDSNGKATVWGSSDGISWFVVHRANSSSPVGNYRFIMIAEESGVVFDSLTKGTQSFAPTMYFRYIESPDNNYNYPLFATEEEANYFDLQNGGTGTSSTNVYPDEPTFSVWHEPTNGHIHNGTSAPTSAILFEGNAINWTEITSQVNADLAPSAYSNSSVTVDELSAVNVQLHPVDAPYTTTIVDNDGSGLSMDSNGVHLQGSAPEVTSDYNANPSDTYTIDVVRTNSYGSATGVLTVVVTNLTAPINPISGFNHESASTAMIDANTMDDGSVTHVNNTVADGERFVIEKAYVQNNILPSLNSTNDKYIIGLANNPHDFSTLELSDFDAAIVWEYETASSHTFKFYRDGSVVQNIVINSMTQAFYDYAIEINGTSAWLIACNLNAINTEPSPADGGTFSNTHEAASIEETAPVKIHMAVLNTTGDISTSDIETITTPSAPTSTILTPWTKALDFSGSNEHLKQVNNFSSKNPISMGFTGTTVAAHSTDISKTSDAIYSRPWATTIVFKSDGNNSNQHIWNYGEGAGSNDDNIYLRTDQFGALFFGWGRDGEKNEYLIASNLGSAAYYGVYIGYKGARYNASNATAANLNNTFVIKLMFYSGGSWIFNPNPNYGSQNTWTTTGARMDRAFGGHLTIGGRGSNRSFHGKIASMVVTTLKANQVMLTDNEIEKMITDPIKWVNNFKVGNTYRRASFGSASSNFQINQTNSAEGTQVWLMGDGTLDSYANGMRNYIQTGDQNFTKMQLNSMVSNDIENVNIAGLS